MFRLHSGTSVEIQEKTHSDFYPVAAQKTDQDKINYIWEQGSQTRKITPSVMFIFLIFLTSLSTVVNSMVAVERPNSRALNG